LPRRPGRKSDFVSRFFGPRAGIPEDPVTGSAHCTLILYWAERLKRAQLHAFQVSARGGELFCEERGERVRIAGRAVTYSSGFIFPIAWRQHTRHEIFYHVRTGIPWPPQADGTTVSIEGENMRP
jgi:hypothetical protein